MVFASLSHVDQAELAMKIATEVRGERELSELDWDQFRDLMRDQGWPYAASCALASWLFGDDEDGCTQG